MIHSGYYPAGTEFDSNAPWNEIFPDEVQVEVDIVVVLRKTHTIVMEEGFDSNDLLDAFNEQIGTPEGWECDEVDLVNWKEL